MLEHGHQPAVDGSPEDLDLGVLRWAIWKRRLLQHAQPREAFDNFRRGHSGAVIAQGSARQATLLERLAETMDDDLCRLGEIPLQVAGKARTVVEHAEQNRGRPLAACGENLA